MQGLRESISAMLSALIAKRHFLLIVLITFACCLSWGIAVKSIGREILVIATNGLN